MMDPRSEAILAHVHPALANVMRGAVQQPQPFVLIYGIRTLAAEAQAVATGHSKTMHSRHLPDPNYKTDADPDGLACAVDVAALHNGQVWFAPGQEERVFGQINRQVQVSAIALNIPLEWGGAAVGAWIPGVESHFRDWGHFQLPWAQYP